MGTLLAVSVAGRREEHARHVRGVFEIAARCERVMSRHDPDSDVSRLNRSAGTGAEIHGPDLARILRVARGLSRRLEGAFDPTIGPLIEAWRRSARRERAPSPAAVADALARVGARTLQIAGDRVSLLVRGASVDLDGFGKGLALDRIAARLRRTRCAPTILNFGESSLVAVGRPTGRPWSIALRDPRGGFAGAFVLRNRACSTSSTFGRPLRARPRVVGDIIDPRTGHAAACHAQVTVVARSAAAAEAISTALIVLGRGAVDSIAHRMKAEVCWIDDGGICATPRFGLRRIA